MTLPEIKKHHSITDKQVAKAMGYKSVDAYKNSSAKLRIDSGIEYFYNLGRESK